MSLGGDLHCSAIDASVIASRLPSSAEDSRCWSSQTCLLLRSLRAATRRWLLKNPLSKCEVFSLADIQSESFVTLKPDVGN